jgi:hypothetical protein
MQARTYILEGTQPVPEPDPVAWARWCAAANRLVAVTQVTRALQVVTVFLGMDHNTTPGGAPILFETRVAGTGGPLEDACERYRTWEEAVQGHTAMSQRCVHALVSAPGPQGSTPRTMTETLQALRARGSSDQDEAIPDDTQLSWAAWTAKVEVLLAEWRQRQQPAGEG